MVDAVTGAADQRFLETRVHELFKAARAVGQSGKTGRRGDEERHAGTAQLHRVAPLGRQVRRAHRVGQEAWRRVVERVAGDDATAARLLGR